MSKNNGGPAFPQTPAFSPLGDLMFPGHYGLEGMTLRDYFAIRCPDDEINRRMPLTAGAMRDELLRRDLIPLNQKSESVLDAYSDSDVAKLRCLVRYDYADDMLAARSTDQ